MSRLSYLLSLCVFAHLMHGAASLVPGIKSGLYGDIVGNSDFELNLRPPEESLKDVEEALDALMKSEDLDRKSALADFASDKERMLEAEKIAIQEIVASAFQPLLAAFKK